MHGKMENFLNKGGGIYEEKLGKRRAKNGCKIEEGGRLMMKGEKRR